jgi:hypothetical protein
MEVVILSIILKHIIEAVQTVTSLFFNVNGAARDTDNNKLHNETRGSGEPVSLT